LKLLKELPLFRTREGRQGSLEGGGRGGGGLRTGFPPHKSDRGGEEGKVKKQKLSKQVRRVKRGGPEKAVWFKGVKEEITALVIRLDTIRSSQAKRARLCSNTGSMQWERS